MTHDDVARVRDLPARRLAARALHRPLSGDWELPEEPTARTLVRPLQARPLTRATRAGR